MHILKRCTTRHCKVPEPEYPYSGVVNVVPDRFHFPLLGFVKLAKGSHKGLQTGF
jgi:hypothetical protein